MCTRPGWSQGLVLLRCRLPRAGRRFQRAPLLARRDLVAARRSVSHARECFPLAVPPKPSDCAPGPRLSARRHRAKLAPVLVLTRLATARAPSSRILGKLTSPSRGPTRAGARPRAPSSAFVDAPRSQCARISVRAFTPSTPHARVIGGQVTSESAAVSLSTDWPGRLDSSTRPKTLRDCVAAASARLSRVILGGCRGSESTAIQSHAAATLPSLNSYHKTQRPRNASLRRRARGQPTLPCAHGAGSSARTPSTPSRRAAHGPRPMKMEAVGGLARSMAATARPVVSTPATGRPRRWPVSFQRAEDALRCRCARRAASPTLSTHPPCSPLVCTRATRHEHAALSPSRKERWAHTHHATEYLVAVDSSGTTHGASTSSARLAHPRPRLVALRKAPRWQYAHGASSSARTPSTPSQRAAYGPRPREREAAVGTALVGRAARLSFKGGAPLSARRELVAAPLCLRYRVGGASARPAAQHVDPRVRYRGTTAAPASVLAQCPLPRRVLLLSAPPSAAIVVGSRYTRGSPRGIHMGPRERRFPLLPQLQRSTCRVSIEVAYGRARFGGVACVNVSLRLRFFFLSRGARVPVGSCHVVFEHEACATTSLQLVWNLRYMECIEVAWEACTFVVYISARSTRDERLSRPHLSGTTLAAVTIGRFASQGLPARLTRAATSTDASVVRVPRPSLACGVLPHEYPRCSTPDLSSAARVRVVLSQGSQVACEFSLHPRTTSSRPLVWLRASPQAGLSEFALGVCNGGQDVSPVRVLHVLRYGSARGLACSTLHRPRILRAAGVRAELFAYDPDPLT
ncbi:hypothetical protein DFH08DRAFT_798307 [Mycena albidolilacea]|uniref:Uncharacterized protein n=1 Tax=Mycena albidolilacea TaxID=1033008 RepID=A0AAD7ANQ1_9AGAR|nr:hypothetical protein DFH08DRAFT_798307 [Mycena albidolilacea]